MVTEDDVDAAVFARLVAGGRAALERLRGHHRPAAGPGSGDHSLALA